MDRDGRVWIMKTEEATAPAELTAEAVGWLLAKAIGVDAPDAGVCLDPGRRAWLSLQRPQVVHWDPAYADRLVNYDALGAMVVLDVLIMNGDRHAENLLLEPRPDEAHLFAWTIDAGNAGAGYPKAFTVESSRDRLPSATNYVTGLPLSAMATGMQRACALASALPEPALRALTEEAQSISNLSSEETRVLVKALGDRCAAAQTLTEEFVETLELRQ